MQMQHANDLHRTPKTHNYTSFCPNAEILQNRSDHLLLKLGLHVTSKTPVCV